MIWEIFKNCTFKMAGNVIYFSTLPQYWPPFLGSRFWKSLGGLKFLVYYSYRVSLKWVNLRILRTSVFCIGKVIGANKFGHSFFLIQLLNGLQIYKLLKVSWKWSQVSWNCCETHRFWCCLTLSRPEQLFSQIFQFSPTFSQILSIDNAVNKLLKDFVLE